MADVSDPSLPDARRSVNQLNKLRLIARFAARYRWRIVAALTALVVATMASLGVVYSLQPIIDKGFATDDPSSIDRYFLQLFAIIAVLSVATALRFHFVTTLGERVVADLRKAVHAHVVGLQPVFFEDNRPSEIASRLTADTTLIQTVVGSSASIALRNALMFVGGLIMLLLINPALVGLTALAIPLVIVPIAVLGGRVRALSRSSQDRVADVGAMANEALSAIQVVQAFTQERSEAARFSTAVERAFDTARRRVRVRSWMTAIVILLVFGAVDLVLWQGAKSVIAGTMTGGQMAAFVGYSVMVAAAAGAIVEVYGDLMRAAGAAGRLSELLATEPGISPPADPVALPDPPIGRVSFKDVVFHYPSRPKVAALDGFSLDIAPGETVALVGPSGAGKSTVLQLVLRFFDPERGRIMIDGVDLTRVDPAALRARLAVVPQETVIFSGTIQDNIRYGRPDASDAEVAAAAAAAAADEFIDALPDGLATDLGDRGVRLSGGQRQRIAIARAVLRDAPILLLDEATSALDAESELLVQQALDRLMAGRTTVVIAHRLATVLKADRIVVMDGGGVVSIGQHEELLAREGLYARLASLQFGLNAAQ